MKKSILFLIVFLVGCQGVNLDELPSISRAEIAQNADSSSCFVGYNGLVYDLTDWLLQHPGGNDAISPFCGSVEEFEDNYRAQHGNVSRLFINEPVGVLND